MNGLVTDDTLRILLHLSGVIETEKEEFVIRIYMKISTFLLLSSVLYTQNNPFSAAYFTFVYPQLHSADKSRQPRSPQRL